MHPRDQTGLRPTTRAVIRSGCEEPLWLTLACEAGRTGQSCDPEHAAAARARGEARAEAERDPVQAYALLTQALCTRHPHVAMQALHETGALAAYLPELEATVDFSQEAGRRHKDVWEHTKTVVWQSVPTPTVRWAAALHDIGKVPTRRFLPGGGVTFHGHAELGQRMFERGPVRRIAFPEPVRVRVSELIRLHLRPGQYEPGWTDSAVRRFRKEAGEHLDDLLNLSRADITSKRPGKRKRCLRSISALARRIRELDALDNRPRPLPSGLGHALIRELGLTPGPQIKVLRERLEQACHAGTLESGREPSYYVAAARELV